MTYALPAVEPIESDGPPLLTDDVLAAVLSKHSPRDKAGDGKPFGIKALNIMDPLLSSNNLGRSVSRANFMRIRKAFGHAARMLEDVFEAARQHPASLPEEVSGGEAVRWWWWGGVGWWMGQRWMDPCFGMHKKWVHTHSFA